MPTEVAPVLRARELPDMEIHRACSVLLADRLLTAALHSRF